MRSFALIVLVLLLSLAGWAFWTYSTTEDTVRDIASRLPSEESLGTMSLEDTEQELKLAMIECGRVANLEANPIARLLRGDEIKLLSDRCMLIKEQQDALRGP